MTTLTYDPAELAAAPPSVQLHNQMQIAAAGHTVEDVLSAAIMNLASIIGFASATPAEAIDLIHTIRGDLVRQVESEWDRSRAVRATMNLADGGRA